MPQSSAAVDRVDLEPGVKTLRDPVLEGYVNSPGPLPSIASDHRAGELAHEAAVLACEHAVRDIGEFRHPNHLRVGLRVLSRVEHEVENIVGRDARDGRCPFASDHALRS